MTKTYNFYTKSNSNNSSIFLNNTNYSEILDDLITTDIVKKNKYLFDSIDTSNYDDDAIILSSSKLKAGDILTKATKFLANYKKYKKTYNLPFIIGKMYTLLDGTPVIFYDDEIQIGFDTFKYNKFADLSFLNNLTTATKKIIINIYNIGGADININLL